MGWIRVEVLPSKLGPPFASLLLLLLPLLFLAVVSWVACKLPPVAWLVEVGVVGIQKLVPGRDCHLP